MVTSAGSVGFQAGECLLDLLGDFQRVGVRLFLDGGDHGGLHVEAAVTALERRPFCTVAMFLTRIGVPSRTATTEFASPRSN